LTTVDQSDAGNLPCAVAAIFATPVAVIVLAARYVLAPKARTSLRTWDSVFSGTSPARRRTFARGYRRSGGGVLAAEMWLADQYLGTLMIVTVIPDTVRAAVRIAGVGQPDVHARVHATRRWRSPCSWSASVFSAAASFGYKNRSRARIRESDGLHGSSQPESGYSLDRVPVPGSTPRASRSGGTRSAWSLCARARAVMGGYHIVDRNLLTTSTTTVHADTPLLPNYRASRYQKVEEARALRACRRHRRPLSRVDARERRSTGGAARRPAGYVAFIFVVRRRWNA
jgi:hypothetical protein